MEYFAVPFSSDEDWSMYFYEDNLMEASIYQDNISLEQLKHIYATSEVDLPNWDFEVLIASVMHYDVLANGIHLTKFHHEFNRMAIIPISQLEKIKKFNNIFSKPVFCDSAVSALSEAFTEICCEFAAKVITISTKAELDFDTQHIKLKIEEA